MRPRSLLVRYAAGLAFAYLLTAAEVVAIVISLTGLIYTYVWGSGFQYAAQKTEAYDLLMKPMLSKSAPEAKDLPIDRIVQIAQQKVPGNNLSIRK